MVPEPADKRAFPVLHWTAMTGVHSGNAVVNYANCAIRAIGRVLAEAVEGRNSDEAHDREG